MVDEGAIQTDRDRNDRVINMVFSSVMFVRARAGRESLVKCGMDRKAFCANK